MSEPFDPDAFLAERRQKKPVAQPVPEASEDLVDGDALLRGFGQGASFGFTDELSGAAMGGLAKLADFAAKTAGKSDAERDELRYQFTGAQPRETGGQGVEGSAYEAARDEMRAGNRAAKERSPWNYGVAELAGNLAVPVGVNASALKMGGAVLKPWAGRALVGAGLGALSSTGLSEGATASEVVGDTASGAAMGAIAAPLLGAATDKLGTTAARWMQNASRENALKAAGLSAGISDKARQLGIDNADDLLALGAKARDEGLIRPFGRPADVARRTDQALSEAANAKLSALQELDDMAAAQGRRFDFNRIAQRGDDLKPGLGWDPLSRENAGKGLELLGKASAAEGGFEMADQVRRAAGKGINWKAAAFGQQTPEAIRFQRKAYGVIADEIAEQAAEVEQQHLFNTWNRMRQGRLPGPEDLGATNQLRAMNSRMSTLMDIDHLANAEATRAVARQPIGLKDSIFGSALAAGGLAGGGDPMTSALLGGAAAGASSFARARLPSALTHVQNATSKALPRLAPKAEPFLIRAGSENNRLPRAYAAMMEKLGLTKKDEKK